LAPRGWNCFGLSGSNGDILFVSPASLGAGLLSVDPTGIAGPAIQVTESIGDTSGRFAVARMIARYSPQRIGFVKNVIAEGVGYAAKDFPTGPYSDDRLISRSDSMVEYQTPPRSKGLGTASRLTPNDDPIRSVVILRGDTPDVLQLTVRLPPGMTDLTAPIIQQAEGK
jgi:hypothetical protein